MNLHLRDLLQGPVYCTNTREKEHSSILVLIKSHLQKKYNIKFIPVNSIIMLLLILMGFEHSIYSQNNYATINWDEKLSAENYNEWIRYSNNLISNPTNPDFPTAGRGYALRGVGKFKYNDYEGALNDYNTAISFRECGAYFYRAILKLHQNDPEGAFCDYLNSDSCTALGNGSPNLHTISNLEKYIIEFNKSVPDLLSNHQADSILKSRNQIKIFLKESDYLMYINDSQQNIDFFSNTDRRKIIKCPDDSAFYKKLVTYDFYQTYMIYLCMYPNGKFAEKIKSKLSWLMLQKAVLDINLPDTAINAGQSPYSNVSYPYWSLNIVFKETGKKIGYFSKGSYKIVDKNGTEWYATAGGQKFSTKMIKPGKSYVNDFWLAKKELCGGYIVFTFNIIDCAGNQKTYFQKVHLVCQ